MSRGEASLAATQAWFSAVISHPTSAAAGIAEASGGAAREEDLRRVVTAGPALTALERMDIYHYAYRARLVECLADDYPALQGALGGDFEALARDYIARYPSASFSLNAFGRHMAALCRERSEEWSGFAADLATLEWAMVEVIHADDGPTLSLEALQSSPVERWAFARLRPGGAVRVHRFGHPVNAFLTAFREGAEPARPEPMPTATAIYRSGLALRRLDLSPLAATLLEALFAGERLGDALATLAAEAESAGATEEVSQSVMVWFREWVASGFFGEMVVD